MNKGILHLADGRKIVRDASTDTTQMRRPRQWQEFTDGIRYDHYFVFREGQPTDTGTIHYDEVNPSVQA